VSDQKKLILIGLAISCLIVLAAVVQGKSDGPVGPPPTAPTSAEAQPQNALTELAIETGYDIGGEPKYDAKLGRWAMLAAVPGCKVKVVLGGNRGPEKQSPEGLSVLSIGEQQLQNPVPLAAEDLKRNPEWRRLLDCV
jgi:hypothetical protein